VCTSTDLARSSRGFVHGEGGAGLIKLVFDRADNVLIGATSVGPTGGEVLSMLSLAVHAGITSCTEQRCLPTRAVRSRVGTGRRVQLSSLPRR
jgi:pyruvate/2-oxoglutarate dehydrogenase complex dihydrolipoamide dehydrogenase (E3) component